MGIKDLLRNIAARSEPAPPGGISANFPLTAEDDARQRYDQALPYRTAEERRFYQQWEAEDEAARATAGWEAAVAADEEMRRRHGGPDYAADVAAHEAAWRRAPTEAGYAGYEAAAPLTPAGLLARQAEFAELDSDARDEYLGCRAAELAEAADGGQGRRDDVGARMTADGVMPADAGRVLATASEWAATAQASPPEPDVSTSVHNAEPEAEGPDGFLAAPAAEDANPHRRGWVEASERYDELLDLQEADPEAVTNQQVTNAYWARDRAFNAMYESTPSEASREVDQIVDAALGAGAAIDGAAAETGELEEPEWDSADSSAYQDAAERDADGNAWQTGTDAQGREYHAGTSNGEPYRQEWLPERQPSRGDFGPAEGLVDEPEWDSADSSAYQDAAELDAGGPVPYELTELGAAQAVADQMTAREVGPGYLASVADREAEL